MSPYTQSLDLRGFQARFRRRRALKRHGPAVLAMLVAALWCAVGIADARFVGR